MRWRLRLGQKGGVIKIHEKMLSVFVVWEGLIWGDDFVDIFMS
jgi:hypothetical protein